MASALSVETMWQARQLYEKKDERGRRLYSMMEVGALLGISETSVYRAVKNRGRFSNAINQPLPDVKTDEVLAAEASSSLDKLQDLLAQQRAEQQPGSNRSDTMLGEISAEVRSRAAEFLEEGDKK